MKYIDLEVRGYIRIPSDEFDDGVRSTLECLLSEMENQLDTDISGVLNLSEWSTYLCIDDISEDGS